MAKKSKPAPTDAAANSPAPAAPADRDVALVEAAFAAGNNTMVRQLAATSASPPAKELAQRLVATRVVIDQQQILAGVVGLIVVAIAAALTLVRG